MTHYIEVIAAARETVAKMLHQRTGQNGFTAIVTTNGGKTAAASRSGMNCVLDMPSLPPDTILTRTEADRMIAYLVHEVCHMLHTDYAAWEVAVGEGHRVRHWTNALEDVRIEAHEMRVGPYKAMRGLLSGLVTHLYAENHTARAAAGTRLGADTLNAPYVLTVLGREANKYDLPIVAPLKNELSPNMRKVMTHALAGVKGCRSTWDCLTLARELVAIEKAIKAQEPQQPKQPPQQPQQPQPQQRQDDDDDQGDDLDDDDTMRQGDDQGDDQDADDQGEGQGDDDDQGDDQGEGDQGDDQGEGEKDGACSADEGDQDPTGEDEGDQGGHGEGEEEGETPETDTQADDKPKKGGMPGGEGGGEHEPGLNDDDQEGMDPDLNLGNTAENIAARTGKEANQYDAAHRLNSMTSDRRKARDKYGAEGATARKHLDDMTPTNGVLHGQVSRLLVSEAHTAKTHHETSGRLDRRALVRMKTGAPDVFSRKECAPGVDTAVMVLIDLSGSMASRIDLARVTAWALAKAAESAGGKLCIAGFKGESAMVTLHYVKDWHQSASQCAGMLCSLVPNQYTPLSAAIVAGAQDLAEQPATRRILIVLTDGQCDLGNSAVKSACSLAADFGVEAVGIGMNCFQVVQAFPERYSVNVEDLNQLATTGLGILSRMLEETGAHK
jgi:Mg-chelatase subunit ChlD